MKSDKELLLKINKLNYYYGKEKVLEDISTVFFSNEFYGILGANGSGKTTLLKNISRSLETEKDTIFIDYIDITKLSNKDLAKKIAYVSQNTDLEFDFSVMDVVFMGRNPYLKRFQRESKDDLDIAENAMNITNTWHLRKKNIGQISGGERQRVIIARALAQQTKVIILDEPISQLDIKHQIEILEILKKLVEDKKVTVIVSIHDLNIAAQYCNQLILMKNGKILEQGLPEEILIEGNIQKAYGVKVFLMKDPNTGMPHLIPFRKKIFI